MMKFCSFCCKAQTAENLKHVSSGEINLNFKLKTAFKIELDFKKFSEICCECERKLEVSWEFYEQVIKAQEVQSQCVVKEEEEVEDPCEATVKVENIPIEPEKQIIFPEFYPTYTSPIFTQNYSGFPIKEEGNYTSSLENTENIEMPPSEDFLRQWMNIKPSTSNPVGSNPSIKRSYVKKSQSNSGNSPKKERSKFTQRCKTVQSISMLDVFGNEINERIFFEPPEVMENLEEDPRLWSEYLWRCSECEEIYVNIIEMNKHLVRTHRRKYYRGTCLQCQTVSTNYARFLNHAISHYNNLKFCCVVCSEHHKNLLDLYKHQQTAHSSLKIIFCLYCGMHFSCGTELDMHMVFKHKRAKRGDMYECDICGEKLNFRMQISKHILQHRSRDIPCNMCTRMFRFKDELKVHQQNIHNLNDKHKICPDCGRTFPNTGVLNRHYKANHTDFKVTCEVCQKVFNSVHRLKAHSVCHQEVGAHQCPHCDKNYKFTSSLLYHIRRAHTGEKPFCCPIQDCDYRAIDFPNAKKHIKIVHGSNEKPIKV